ncbi:MAG: 2-C-methyl-D-erythritol 4-phosphate cytidylyltransferase, partial [Eubacterium sp.]
MTTYAAILAGGVGNRMHSATIPKQFLQLGDRPIIIWTIQKLVRSHAFDYIYVAIHPDWKSYLQELITNWNVDASSLTVIDGGKERLDSIENVIDAIYAEHSVEPEDKILIHDAVRPFITRSIINDSLEALNQHPAVVAAIPATDTMLWIENGDQVDSMPDRSKLYNGQAPDSFRLPVLEKSLKELTP